MVFKNLCVLVLWTKVSSALKGLNDTKLHEKIMICAEEELLVLEADYSAGTVGMR